MSRTKFKKWMKATGRNVRLTASYFQRSMRTVQRWRSGATKIPNWVAKQIGE